MGRRSNTAPIELHEQRNGSRILKHPTRSTTVIEAIKVPNANGHDNHHVKIPHPHNPFTRHDPTPPPSSRPSNIGPRPGLPQRQNSVRTRYIDMLLNLDDIPRLHNILAAAFTWILLAGFLIFPGTFTSISSQVKQNDQQAAAFLATVKNVQLLIIGGVCSGVGALGMVWLWWRWRQNYVWLLNRIFLPGCLNSLAGLISTLISVYGQQDGQWSITARVTAAVTGGIMVVTGILFAIYNFAVLSRVKSKHRREMADENEDETVKEKLQRQAMEPALEPGSVV